MVIAIIMIDGCVKRKHKLGLELQSSRVIERCTNVVYVFDTFRKSFCWFSTSQSNLSFKLPFHYSNNFWVLIGQVVIFIIFGKKKKQEN